MNIQTRGIILKQTKILNDRRMLVMFSEDKGKISVSAGSGPSGRTKSALAYKPFTLGKYELYKGREIYSINKAETLRSFFSIGEDVDKYMCASYVLEFMDKLLMEEAPAPKLFSLLCQFFDLMEKRPREYLFLVRAFQIKAIQYSGYMPKLESCVICGRKEGPFTFGIEAGGVVCSNCLQEKDIGLIYKTDSGIIDKIKYIAANPLKKMGNLYLDGSSLSVISELIKRYIAFHMDIQDLKSEEFLSTEGFCAERK